MLPLHGGGSARSGSPRGGSVTAAVTLAAALLAIAGCRGGSAPERGEGAFVTPSSPATAGTASTAGTGAGAAVPAEASACGELGCLSFPDPLSAFRFVLAHEPRVLALGEAHAQRGTEGIPSSTKRFTDDFLPLLVDRAHALVLELWLGEPKCGKVVEVVKEQQKPVVTSQAKSNPNEMVALGDRAYGLGIRPFPLRPTCDDYAPIADAGADGVPLMLELIARLSRERIEALLATDAGAKTMVLAYGGAMHNDIAPLPGRETYSFGPDLRRSLGDRYVELDLIVGAYVKDAEPWTSLPWVKPYLAMPKTERTLVFRPQEGSFVLVFP